MSNNLIVHIVLPQSLALVDGSTLGEEATFDVVSELTPYYSSVSEVRLHGGIYLRKLSDLTIATMVYHMSSEVDVRAYRMPRQPPGNVSPYSEEFKTWRLFAWGRDHYVSLMAAHDLILGIFDLTGTRGSRTLGNLSISRQSLMKDEGLPAKLTSLEKEAAELLPIIYTGANLGFGGHARPRMAAKSVNDMSDGPIGRRWLVSGPGGNRETVPGLTSVGGQGKSMKFYSPCFVERRLGRYLGPITVMPLLGL